MPVRRQLEVSVELVARIVQSPDLTLDRSRRIQVLLVCLGEAGFHIENVLPVELSLGRGSSLQVAVLTWLQELGCT